jgi:hypothetical protein
LHVCLRVPGDPQNALATALRDLTTDGGDYAEVDWYALGAKFPERLLEAAAMLRPTLVFAQIQTAGILTAGDVEMLRRASPGVVVCQWDGDHRHNHTDTPDRDWFRHLGKACDINACVCTRDVEEYAAQGVPGAAYLQIGVDADTWRPTFGAENVPPIVMLAAFNKLPGYVSRIEAVKRLSPTGNFAVYGNGWQAVGFPAAHRPFLSHAQEAPVYSACKAAISASIRNDLPRYTSDRLLRCLASGALTLVEHFPDMEGLGLRDGENCAVWYDVDGLERLVADVLSRPNDEAWEHIRHEARELALTHTWDSRMFELAHMVEAVRAA